MQFKPNDLYVVYQSVMENEGQRLDAFTPIQHVSLCALSEHLRESLAEANSAARLFAEHDLCPIVQVCILIGYHIHKREVELNELERLT